MNVPWMIDISRWTCDSLRRRLFAACLPQNHLIMLIILALNYTVTIVHTCLG